MRPTSATTQGGRQPGTANYWEDDLKALLDLVEVDLPIRQSMWQRITDSFNEWVRRNGSPAQTQKPLKTNFEAVSDLLSFVVRYTDTLTACLYNKADRKRNYTTPG